MNHRPCILHLRASRFVGGPEKQLLGYAQMELDGPYEIILGTFTGRGEGGEFYQAAVDLKVRAAAFPDHLLGQRSAVRELARFLKREGVALVCTHGYKADIVGIIAARKAGVPVVPFLRGWTHEDWKVSIYEFLDRHAIARADRIVTLSGLHADLLAKQIGSRDKIHTVINAIDRPILNQGASAKARARLVERFHVSQENFLIASAGRLSPEKGTADLLRAAALLKDEKFSDIRWVIFGEGVLQKSLQALARELGVHDRVIFAGFEKDLQNLLPGFDLLVNPSLSEQMPNIVLEAMAAGIPVVATDVGGVSEIAGPMAALALVPPDKPNELARCISELKADPNHLRALASCGYQRVLNAFSRQAQINAMHNLYKELIPPRPEGMDPHTAPFFSVVIPARNEEVCISEVLTSLLAQKYPADRFEILVADGMSTDGTKDIVEGYSARSSVSVRYLQNPLQLSSAGRNQGVRNSRGEYILFIDGHSHIPSVSLLADSAAVFEKTGAHCLCRPQPLDPPGNTTFQRAVAAVRSSVLGHGRDSTIYDMEHEGFVAPMSSGACYRRAVFDRVGLYDETFDACEDVEFNFRVHQAGLRSYSSPRLQVKYYPRKNLRQLWRQMHRYGVGRFRLAHKHPSAGNVFQAVPALLVIWLILGCVFSFVFSTVRWLYFASLLFYFGGILIGSFSILIRHGFRIGLLAPLIYLDVHLALGVGYLRSALSSVLVGAKGNVFRL